MESSSEEIPIESQRSWYRLHWITWVLVCCVLGSLVVENLVGQYSPDGSALFHGWPEHIFRRWSAVPGKTPFWYPSHESQIWPPSNRWQSDNADFRYLPLSRNIIVALVILLATIFTTESYFRRQAKWYQFSIQNILALTTFVALLLANAKYLTTPILTGYGDVLFINLVRWHGDSTWEYIPFFFIGLGCWCVFWTVWRLIGVGVGRVCKQTNHP